MSGQEGQDFSTLAVGSEEARRTVESTCLQMPQEFMDERSASREWTTDGVANADDVGRGPTSRQWYFPFHLVRSHVVLE